jgi:predicted  nucleic acid-binding Zn-ribbon protein
MINKSKQNKIPHSDTVLTEATIQFSSSEEVKRWLEDQTNSILTPVHDEAKKLRDDTDAALQAVADISKQLFDTSSKEIERRNMKVYNRARALNKLARLFLDRLKKLTPPEQISYDTLNRYTQDTQKVLTVTDIDIKNWFPRISPFFIMDRRKFLAVYEKAKLTYSFLNDFVTKDYVKTKTLEDTFQLLNELQNLEKQLANLGEQKENLKNERIPLEQEIAEIEQKIDDLKSKGPIDKLNMVNAEIDSLTTELKHTLRHLQKPFIKMQALATSGGGGGITPDELTRINQYLETPFDALVAEQRGYPMLKEILQKLEGMLTEDKLKLKSDKARKAEQAVNEMLHNNSLAKLQIRCVEMATNRDQLLASAKMDEIKQHLMQYQEQVDQLKARKTSVETREAVKANTYKENVDKISNLKHTIERNISNSIDTKIQIE